MNYSGSYRHLIRNARAAMLGAIEIYNKPKFDYRDECCVILLLNSWELLLKGLISKAGKSIFYRKKRGEPYRTLSWRDALLHAEALFPKTLPALPIRKNLELLSTFRDNSVHFYNAEGFGVVLYSLAQTSVTNFRDLLSQSFGVDIAKYISWQLLPLGLKPPIDAIHYMSKGVEKEKGGRAAVRQFLAEIALASGEIERAGLDTGRLMTLFTVKLESTKKIEKADFVVGVEKAANLEGPLAIIKTHDPNLTHPLRQMDIVKEVGSLNGQPFTSHTFQALTWRYELKNKTQYCWSLAGGGVVRYSRDVITLIKGLSSKDVDAALVGYREFHRVRSRKAGMTKTA